MDGFPSWHPSQGNTQSTHGHNDPGPMVDGDMCCYYDQRPLVDGDVYPTGSGGHPNGQFHGHPEGLHGPNGRYRAQPMPNPGSEQSFRGRQHPAEFDGSHELSRHADGVRYSVDSYQEQRWLHLDGVSGPRGRDPRWMQPTRGSDGHHAGQPPLHPDDMPDSMGPRRMQYGRLPDSAHGLRDPYLAAAPFFHRDDICGPEDPRSMQYADGFEDEYPQQPALHHDDVRGFGGSRTMQFGHSLDDRRPSEPPLYLDDMYGPADRHSMQRAQNPNDCAVQPPLRREQMHGSWGPQSSQFCRQAYSTRYPRGQSTSRRHAFPEGTFDSEDTHSVQLTHGPRDWLQGPPPYHHDAMHGTSGLGRVPLCRSCLERMGGPRDCYPMQPPPYADSRGHYPMQYSLHRDEPRGRSERYPLQSHSHPDSMHGHRDDNMRGSVDNEGMIPPLHPEDMHVRAERCPTQYHYHVGSRYGTRDYYVQASSRHPDGLGSSREHDPMQFNRRHPDDARIHADDLRARAFAQLNEAANIPGDRRPAPRRFADGARGTQHAQSSDAYPGVHSGSGDRHRGEFCRRPSDTRGPQSSTAESTRAVWTATGTTSSDGDSSGQSEERLACDLSAAPPAARDQLQSEERLASDLSAAPPAARDQLQASGHPAAQAAPGGAASGAQVRPQGSPGSTSAAAEGQEARRHPVAQAATDKAASGAHVPSQGSSSAAASGPEAAQSDGDDQIEAARPTAAQRSKAPARRGPQRTDGEITTVMVRNLPPTVTRQKLLDELNRGGFLGLYDYVYLPSCFESGCSKGHAFVNFVGPQIASAFRASWHKSSRFGTDSEAARTIFVMPAEVQGFEANQGKWTPARLARMKNPEFQPFVAVRALTSAIPAAMHDNET